MPSVLHGLLDNLGNSVATGDSKKVLETLKGGEGRIKELLGKIQNERIRDTLTKVQADISQLLKKLSSGEGNLDDVRAFINNSKDKLKQHLADKIKGIAQMKTN